MIHRIVPDTRNNRSILPVQCCSFPKLLVGTDQDGDPMVITSSSEENRLVGVSLRFGGLSLARNKHAFFKFERGYRGEVINKYSLLGWEFFQLDSMEDLAEWLVNL